MYVGVQCELRAGDLHRFLENPEYSLFHAAVFRNSNENIFIFCLKVYDNIS